MKAPEPMRQVKLIPAAFAVLRACAYAGSVGCSTRELKDVQLAVDADRTAVALHSMQSNLKCMGLIERRGVGTDGRWFVTERGMEVLQGRAVGPQRPLPTPAAPPPFPGDLRLMQTTAAGATVIHAGKPVRLPHAPRSVFELAAWTAGGAA